MRSLWFLGAAALCCFAPPLRADDRKPEARTHHVPYRLTKAQHIMVRAKINGKGPYNFIIDTGAPALFVSTEVCRKLGVKPDAKGWGTFDRFDIEGGVSLPKVRGRVEDPFQLKGMNALGLAGADLHGIIGYTVLAKFRMEIDFTRDKMAWTPLNFQPPAPVELGGKGPDLDALGGLFEMAGKLLGKPPMPEVIVRGFLGLDVAEDDKGVVVKGVLGGSPAAAAGLKAGDRITEYRGRTVRQAEDLLKLAAAEKTRPGDEVKLTIERGAREKEIIIKAGEGF
ncbi:MAG TPA: PDZ domain-containing protein [Gemmataceae bacterium]|nr:PDZ domain-containing protein [Gemmataceae bacterium]